jgi:hypothetical protein
VATDDGFNDDPFDEPISDDEAGEEDNGSEDQFLDAMDAAIVEYITDVVAGDYE